MITGHAYNWKTLNCFGTKHPLICYILLEKMKSFRNLYCHWLIYGLVLHSWLCSRRWCIDKLGVFSCKPNINVLIHIWTKGEVGAPLNRFKPSSKIFYWPFQGGTYFVDLLCFFLSCVWYAFVLVCLYVPCVLLLEKGWPLGSHLWCITVSLLLSHWYPGSGVVLNCIDSWSLHPYLLWAQHSIISLLLKVKSA